MSDDDAKKIILARRARFVAAAVASVGIACGKTEAGSAPMPCLIVAIPSDAEPPPSDPGPPPMPCLSPMPADAAAFDPPADAGAADATIPVPCLSIRPPTKEPKKK